MDCEITMPNIILHCAGLHLKDLGLSKEEIQHYKAAMSDDYKRNTSTMEELWIFHYETDGEVNIITSFDPSEEKKLQHNGKLIWKTT